MEYKKEFNKLTVEGKIIYEAPGEIDDLLVNPVNSEEILLIYDAYEYVPDKDKPRVYRQANSPEQQELINQNVLCLDKSGKIIWRVEPTDDKPIDHIYFFEENGGIWLYRRDAWEYKIDPKNGKVLDFRQGI